MCLHRDTSDDTDIDLMKVDSVGRSTSLKIPRERRSLHLR